MSGDTLLVDGGRPLVGTVRVPGDKSISHRALLLAALAEGHSTISGLSAGGDVARTAAAVVALGARVAMDGSECVVEGGRTRLAAPDVELDLGNSGTGMRLLAGVVATLPGTTVLTGDASLRGRPMDRIAAPLALMGATFSGVGSRCLPPIRVTGGSLHAIDYSPPMASAQVKSAVLLAGLDADGETVVREAVATRAHTEEMLAAAGADITIEATGRGRVVRLRRSTLRATTYLVPGDPSQAAFWVVGAQLVEGSRVVVADVDLSGERSGFLEVLRRMGGRIEVDRGPGKQGSVSAAAAPLHGTVVEAAEIPSLDEVPILAVAAAGAAGRTTFRSVGELRVKESDRLAGTAALVRAFGAGADVVGDDLVVTGVDGPLTPASFDAGADHRLAMAAAIAGATCRAGAGTTTITGWSSVATSDPGFADQLTRVRGKAG